MTRTDLTSRLVIARQVQDWLVDVGLRIVLTVVLAILARWLLHRIIDRTVAAMTAKSDRRQSEPGDGSRAARILSEATGMARARHQQRTTTLGSLLRSVVTFVVSAIAVLTVLDLLEIPLGPLLASAGVGGVALGFGAQSLVKDFLSGVFMILEDQYGVGDVIDTGEAIGTVEEVSLRVTRLRDANGVTWYIRNGEVVRIGNMSQQRAKAIVDVPVAYDEDVARVIAVIREVAEEIAADDAWQGRLLETPEVLGVESISGQTMTIRVLAETAPGEKWPLQRELRQRIKTAFDAAGIKAPPVQPFGGSHP